MQGHKKQRRRKAKDREVQSHKRNGLPTHSQVFLETGPVEEFCITGYESLVNSRLVLGDQLLVRNVKTQFLFVEPEYRSVGGVFEPVCMFGSDEDR